MKIRIIEIPSATWQLAEGETTFECTHDEGFHKDTTEVDTMRNGEHDTYTVPIAICEDPDCDEDLDIPPEDLYDEPDDYDPDR